jgi:hypothetical protein
MGHAEGRGGELLFRVLQTAELARIGGPRTPKTSIFFQQWPNIAYANYPLVASDMF